MQCGPTLTVRRLRGKPPKAKKMSGLKVVDDTTFTIKTSETVSNLPVRLGYTVFAPLPDSFFADPEAYEEKPIGAGPFKMDSSKSNTEFVLSKFAEYTGADKPSIDKVTFRVYQDPEAAYTDVLANSLDYTTTTSRSDQLVGDAYKSELAGPLLERETGTIAGSTLLADRRPRSKNKRACVRPSRWPSTGI